jgi:hypothetical protein
MQLQMMCAQQVDEYGRHSEEAGPDQQLPVSFQVNDHFLKFSPKLFSPMTLVKKL